MLLLHFLFSSSKNTIFQFIPFLFLGGGTGRTAVGQSRPVVLRLGHVVSKGVLVLLPCLGKVSPALLVPFGVVGEDTGLLDVAFVVVTLLLGLSLTELLVLGCGKSGGDVGLAGLDLSLLELLLHCVIGCDDFFGFVSFRCCFQSSINRLATSRRTTQK